MHVSEIDFIIEGLKEANSTTDFSKCDFTAFSCCYSK